MHWLWNSTIIKTLCTLCTLYSVHYVYSILKVMLNVWNSYVYKAWSTSWARSKHSNSIINPRSNLSIKSSLKTMANIYQTAYNIVKISKRHSIRIFDNISANLLTIHWSWIVIIDEMKGLAIRIEFCLKIKLLCKKKIYQTSSNTETKKLTDKKFTRIINKNQTIGKINNKF